MIRTGPTDATLFKGVPLYLYFFLSGFHCALSYFSLGYINYFSLGFECIYATFLWGRIVSTQLLFRVPLDLHYFYFGFHCIYNFQFGFHCIYFYFGFNRFNSILFWFPLNLQYFSLESNVSNLFLLWVPSYHTISTTLSGSK